MHSIWYMGIYKKNRPFNHIFGGDRIFRAWYRGIKNAGPRKRAQGRAQDIPYQSISPYHHGIWRIFIECGKNPHSRKSAQGRSARGPILPKSNRNFRQPPHCCTISAPSQPGSNKKRIDFHTWSPNTEVFASCLVYEIHSTNKYKYPVFLGFCSTKKSRSNFMAASNDFSHF